MIELIAGLISGFALCYIGYLIGRFHGFQAGRENALDQMAQRQQTTQRQRR